jgi:hypothetical protein
MRTFRILGLAVLAALAISAFAGAGSASAVSLCSINVATCPGGNIYPEGTTLEADLEGAMIVMGEEEVVVACATSDLDVETFGPGASFVMAEVTGLMFGGCADNAENTCAVQGVNLPYEALIYQPGMGDGLFAIPTGEGGPPSLEIQCGMLTCVYGAAMKFEVGGGAPATLASLTPNLNMQMGSDEACPETATWDPEYAIGEPEPLFVVQNP